MLRRALILGFLVLFVVEIFVVIQVGSAIGVLPTLLLLVLGGVLGGWVINREGRRAWRALQGALAGGEPPDRELSDSALVMAGGVLLAVPGLVTDVFGLVFVLPFTRPLLRRMLAGLVARQLRVGQERLRERVGVYSAEGLGLDGLFPPAEPPHGDVEAPQVIQGRIVREDGPDVG